MLGLAAVSVAAEDTFLAALRKPVPEGVADLQAIEHAARQVAQRVTACTVGVQVGDAQGSGVIVSPDGYVLTAAHVSGKPGRKARITLSDGTELKAQTLGVHTVADIGLLKIADEAPREYAPLVPIDQGPEAGTWCLATGHPNGFQAQRRRR